MKVVILILHVCLLTVGLMPAAEQKQLQELVLPPLPVSIEPTLGLTPVNRQEWIENPERQKQEDTRNLQLFESKKFPLAWLIAGFGLLLCVLIARRHYAVWLEWLQSRWRKPVDIKKESLQAMQRASLEYTDKPADLYVALSDIVRNYLERVYHFPIKEKTTQELIETIRPLDLSDQGFLSSLFKRADLVKFAKDSPTEKECKEACEKAHSFINEF